MAKTKIRVIWSKQAKSDLKSIFKWVKKKTKSSELAINVRTDIINSSKNIVFIEQYQIEELLGDPFRRITIRHYKLIYKAESPSQIRILKVFDTHKHPSKIKITSKK